MADRIAALLVKWNQVQFRGGIVCLHGFVVVPVPHNIKLDLQSKQYRIPAKLIGGFEKYRAEYVLRRATIGLHIVRRHLP